MGYRLRAGKPPQYFTEPPRPTQPPTLRGTGNEYRPKCGDSVWLRSKGRKAHSMLWINVWVWQVKLCDPSLIRAIPERFRDECRTHYKALYINKCPVYLHVFFLILLFFHFYSVCTLCLSEFNNKNIVLMNTLIGHVGRSIHNIVI